MWALRLFSKESYLTKMRSEPLKWKSMGIRMSFEIPWLTCVIHIVVCKIAMTMFILAMDGHFLCPLDTLYHLPPTGPPFDPWIALTAPSGSYQ